MSLCQWPSHPSSGIHRGGEGHMGQGVQGAEDSVPDSRLPRTQPGLPPAGEILRLQAGQHPAAGGRLPLPTV